MAGKGMEMAEHRGVRVGQRTAATWQALEEEYSEPIRDIIVHFREDGNSWATIAGALGCCQRTLQSWRERLGIPLEPHVMMRDLEPVCPSEQRARDLGYRNLTHAIRTLRSEGCALPMVAERLGLHPGTISEHMPEEWKGVQIFTPAEREKRRDHARRFLGRKHHQSGHIWTAHNDALFMTSAQRKEANE